MGTEINQEVTLHFIDKVHDTLNDTIQAENRSGIAVIIVSVLIIALSLGIVSTNQSFTFLGLTFSVSFWIIIWGSAYVNTIFFAMLLSLDILQDRLVKKIEELYKSINFNESELQVYIAIPDLTSSIDIIKFKNPVLQNLAIWPLTILSFIIILVLPIASEVIAFYKMLVLLGWVWWGFISFILLLFVSVIFLVHYVLTVHLNLWA